MGLKEQERNLNDIDANLEALYREGRFRLSMKECYEIRDIVDRMDTVSARIWNKSMDFTEIAPMDREFVAQQLAN